jgi:dynein heavy chain
MSLCDLEMNHLYLSRCLFVLQRRREECERKARRGEMDPRLEYTFQLLIDATGLTRGELMDYVFDGNMVCLPLHSHPCMKAVLRSLYSDLHRLFCKSVTE